MKIALLKGAPRPPEKALIVCAGTVTCRSVAGMASGFNLFKHYFKQNIHSHPNSNQGWEEDLNLKLSNYHAGQNMPLYCRIASQDSYVGGVATVACKSARNVCVSPTHNAQASAEELAEQYKAAVRMAIQDAISLGRPLYLQPLGIGVYGWEPIEAANLFADVFAEFQESELNVQIPIYNQTPGSPDRGFEAQLQARLAQTLQSSIPNRGPNTITSTAHPNPAASNNGLGQRVFLLKCVALLMGVLSATLILIAALAFLSLITTTTMI